MLLAWRLPDVYAGSRLAFATAVLHAGGSHVHVAAPLSRRLPV